MEDFKGKEHLKMEFVYLKQTQNFCNQTILTRIISTKQPHEECPVPLLLT